MSSQLRDIWTEWRDKSRITAQGAPLEGVYAHITHGVFFPQYLLGVPDFTKLPQQFFPDVIPSASVSAVLPSTAPQTQKSAVSMPVPTSNTPADFWQVKFQQANNKLSEITIHNKLLQQQFMDLHRNSQTKIAQLTLEHANTVHSLRAATTQDTQTAITLTQLVADLREVGAEVSELQHDLTPMDPLVSEQITVSNNTPTEVLLHTPEHTDHVLLDVTQTGPPAPRTAALPHLHTTTEPPSQHLVGTVVTERRSARENRGQHRCRVLHTPTCLGPYSSCYHYLHDMHVVMTTHQMLNTARITNCSRHMHAPDDVFHYN